MSNLLLLYIIICYVTCKIPKYTEMKRNETLYFNLENVNSSFYAYLTYEEDYSINDNETDSMLSSHFLSINKKIGFFRKVINKTDNFPDESVFNKSSFPDEKENLFLSLEISDNMILREYFNLEKDRGENYTSVFVFYFKEKFNDSFDPNENYSVSRVEGEILTKDIVINTKLDKDEFKLYLFEINPDISLNYALFSNSIISILYEYDLFGLYKNGTNINFFVYNYNDYETFCFYYLVYNKNNYTQNIYLEYKNDIKDNFYNYIDLTNSSNNKVFADYKGLFYVLTEYKGLYNIKTNGQNYKYIFNDNIENIHNLTDLKQISHYKYTNEGLHWVKKNYFIVLISSSLYIQLEIEKKEIEEIEKEINEFKFEYFKISKGKTLDFNINKTNQSIILKLLSNNNGTVNINNNSYYFNEGNIQVIKINNNKFNITAVDNNFTFAIKLKIPDEYIKFPEFGKYILPKDTYYKFLIYEINVVNHSLLHFEINDNKNISSTYELTSEKNLFEIEKGEIDKFDIQSPYLYLNLYDNITLNETLYLYIYLENLTLNNILIETKYFKPFTFKEDSFTLIHTDDYMNFIEDRISDIYFILPCIGNIQIFIKSSNSIEGKEYYKPFKFSFNGDFNDFITINSRDKNKAIGYINYYNSNKNDYSYIEEESIKPLEVEYFFGALNATHMRFYIGEIFSDSPEIKYILVISLYESDYLFENRCIFFNKFYLNNTLELNNTEIYHFSNDFKINQSEPKLKYYLDLPMPTKIDLLKRNQKFIYKLMGITGPKYKYVKFYDHYYLSTCYETCLKCNWTGTKDKHNCISCIEGKLFQEDNGNCLDECLFGYFKSNKTCKKCNKNCESCSKESENGNNNCLTCNKTSKYKYLVNIPDLGKNCIEECPEGTFVDKGKYQCIIKNENEKNYSYVYIIIGVLGGLIIIAIIIFIYLKIKKRQTIKEDEALMAEMIIKNESTNE